MEVVDLTQRLSEDERQAKADMLEDLEALKVRMEEGVIKGFAYTTCYKDGAVTNGWSGYNCRSDLSIGISLLATRYHNACLDI